MAGGFVSGGLEALLGVRRHGFELELPLEIAEGRTVALLGPNGAGKSTAVAALAGLLPLERGSVRLGGRTLDDPGNGVFVPPEERNIGVVFQDYLLFPHMTVAANIAFGLGGRGLSRSEIEARVGTWAEKLGIAELCARRPADLSGGQAQRVALARALVTEPALLLLDEPLAALDTTTRTRLRRALVDHLAEFAGPRLLITHDPTEAFLLADEIHLVENGRLTQRGTAEDIRLRPRTRYAADLVGSNLLEGEAARGVVRVGRGVLAVAGPVIDGRVLLSVHPRAVALHLSRPEGSPRNAWGTTVIRVEDHGDRVRVGLGDPLPLVAEVTPAAVSELALVPGREVWASIKATEIGAQAV